MSVHLSYQELDDVLITTNASIMKRCIAIFISCFALEICQVIKTGFVGQDRWGCQLSEVMHRIKISKLARFQQLLVTLLKIHLSDLCLVHTLSKVDKRGFEALLQNRTLFIILMLRNCHHRHWWFCLKRMSRLLLCINASLLICELRHFGQEKLLLRVVVVKRNFICFIDWDLCIGHELDCSLNFCLLCLTQLTFRSERALWVPGLR